MLNIILHFAQENEGRMHYFMLGEETIWENELRNIEKYIVSIRTQKKKL